MKRLKTLGVTITATGMLALGLVGCGAKDDSCNRSTVMFYSTTDHYYHYGSPTGKPVPASKVPGSAAKVPGYKPYSPPKAPAAKPAAPAVKPAAPAPKPR